MTKAVLTIALLGLSFAASVRGDETPVCGGTAPQGVESGVDALGALLRSTDIWAVPAACQGERSCPRRLHSRLWAQERVGAQAALKRLKEAGVRLDTQSVAVVDSGFDIGGSGNRLEPAVSTVRDPSGAAFDPADSSNDPAHGTAVASLVSGKEGVGVAPGVRVQLYGVYDSHVDELVHVDQAVEKACDQGHSIINLSIGGLADESGNNPQESNDKDLLNRLRDKGCLVVNSAGNHAYRDREVNLPPDLRPALADSLLRVTATRASGDESVFSSPGEVRAPGESVLAWDSTVRGLRKNAFEDSCSKDASGTAEVLVDGTSFAAPIVSGVAALTRSVLMQESSYINLPGSRRIEILTHILAQSQTRSGVHALKAVELAFLFNQKFRNHGSAAAISALKNNSLAPALKQLPICTQPEGLACAAQGDANSAPSCGADYDCLQGIRDREAVCGVSRSGTLKLFGSAVQKSELEEALHHLKEMIAIDQRENGQVREETRADAISLLDAYLAKTSGLRSDLRSLSRMIDFFTTTLDAFPKRNSGLAGGDQAQVREIYRKFLNHPLLEEVWSFQHSWVQNKLSTSPYSNPVAFEFERLGELFKRVDDRLPQADWQAVLRSEFLSKSPQSMIPAAVAAHRLARLSLLGVVKSVGDNRPDPDVELYTLITEETRKQWESMDAAREPLSEEMIGGVARLSDMGVISPIARVSGGAKASQVHRLVRLHKNRSETLVSTDQGEAIVEAWRYFLDHESTIQDRTLWIGELYASLLRASDQQSHFVTAPSTRQKLDQARADFIQSVISRRDAAEALAVLEWGSPAVNHPSPEIDRYALSWFKQLENTPMDGPVGDHSDQFDLFLAAGDYLAERSSAYTDSERHDMIRTAQRVLKKELDSALATRDVRELGRLADRLALLKQSDAHKGLIQGWFDHVGWKDAARRLKEKVDLNPKAVPAELRLISEEIAPTP